MMRVASSRKRREGRSDVGPSPAVLALLLVAAIALPAAPAQAQSLYWLDTQYPMPTLSRSTLDGLGVFSIALAPGTLPEGLATAASGRVYWTEAAWSNAKIHRVADDLNGDVALVSGASVLRGLAVDDTAQMLYWTSSNLAAGSTIQRSTLTGAGATTLIALPAAANPRGIAVNHAAGRIYWADFDQDAIYSANLDGTMAGVWLGLATGSAPYGVTVDPATQGVYWTEYGSGMLRRADAAGTNVTSILMGLANPTYVAFEAAAGRLYWTEGGAGAQRIRRANVNGSGLVTLPPPLATYGGIAIGSGAVVAVEAAELPTEFAIDRVWPTPSRGPLRLAFSLPRDADVRLVVMDVQGREVAVLADGLVPAGRHERLWSGRTRGGSAPAGIYFARLTAEARSWVRRVVLTR
jgi:hypothetical protein